MSNLSGVSGSNGNQLLSILQNIAGTIRTSYTTSTTQPTSPEDFLTSELEKQGYTGSKLSDLQAKIEATVQSVQSSSSGQTDPSKIHDAINKVLKDAGVNTDEIDADLQAQGPGGPRGPGGTPPGGPPPGGMGSTSNATSSTDTDNEISALLKQMGVDPKKFESALETALKNTDGTGSIDLSKLFASAGTGSQVDVMA
jgi:hypothetical protein